ncbi:group II intron reverse transcriptase/maturase [Desulfococcaceae bacterium OttesenSCG-928-F15]|nr:group II intron reverse transcriptase/maturase [Desulfococcaceae bacterium OttesenSCG-928-F15]
MSEQTRSVVSERLHKASGSNKAKAEIWTPKMLEALANGVKGGKWFSLIDKVYRPETLETAWLLVKRNKGASGVDGQSVKKFNLKAETYLAELSEALKSGKYQPAAVRRVEIPKEKGKTRPLGIPTVKDRIVQTAVKMAIEPIFEAEFLDMSYGFRPERGAKDALREVDALVKAGYTHVVDADLQSYFDSIPQDLLMDRVKEKISDGRLLKVLESWLKQEIMTENARWTPVKGTPQGAVISPLLANIYLHPLDKLITGKGYRMVRYADDFVILCQSRLEAETALSLVQVWVTENGLTLHPDKTHIGDCRKIGEGFEFLGYRFEAGNRTVRKKSLKKFRDRIRGLTPRQSGQSLEQTIKRLNRTLKGWFEYFKHAHRWTFETEDSMIRRRLRAQLLKNEKKTSLGITRYAHKKWPNAFFAEKGLFTMHEAYGKAIQSR